MSNKRVLTFGIFNLRPDEWFNIKPICVHFSVGEECEINKSFDVNDSVWHNRFTDRNYKNTIKLFNDLQGARVVGQNLMKFVTYKNVSMWQFVHSYTFWSFYRTVELIRLINEIINENSPELIRVLPLEDYASHIWLGVLKEISDKHSIQLVVCNDKESKITHTHNCETKKLRSLKKYLKSPYLKFRGLIKSLRDFLLQTNDIISDFVHLHIIGKKRGKLVFATVARHWVIEPGQTDKYYDEQFFPLLPALRKSGWNEFVGIDCPYFSDLEERAFSLRKHSQEPGVSWRRFYSYTKPHRLRVITRKAEQEFSKQAKILLSDPEFNEHFSWEGIRLMPALKKELEEVFYSYLPECARLLDIARQILKAEKPDAVIATYEIGRFARALIIQAGFMGIPTIGLMHGMIFDNNYDYMHLGIEPEIIDGRIGFNVPKVTCVWGSFWKNNLTIAGQYPDTAVSITGNWRYDKIPDMIKKIDANKVRREFKVKDGNKVIAILAGGRFNQDYVSTVLEVVSKVPNCTPLIKLHPSDGPSLYLDILNRLGFSQDIIIEGRLIELLAISDLVISQFSTVISEAVLLQKPVIMVNLERIPEWGSEYSDFDVCLPVEDSKELMPSIKLIFNDNQVQERLSEARARFIEQFFYRYDGRAAERVANTLNSLLK